MWSQQLCGLFPDPSYAAEYLHLHRNGMSSIALAWMHTISVKH